MQQSEKRLTFSNAARFVPGRPNPSTLWRWARKGISGVHLEYIRFGRRIFTSREALERFAERVAAADTPIGTPHMVPAMKLNPTRQQQIDAANAVLRKAGI